MSKIRLNIDGIEVAGYQGQSILEIAKNYNIDIPTLCHDEKVKSYGSCGMCVVEAQNNPKLIRSCATEAANGMIIKTKTKRIIDARTVALELLMSDHRGDCKGPCTLICPGNTDCQTYVGLIANGEFEEANRVVKESLPFPASIGRVCPHPCEDSCRRALVDEPIAIANLKYFIGDMDLELDLEDMYIPDMRPKTGKLVNIIGGGPGGVSAAYFLLREGHDVVVYDKMPKLGGMLRYGIPQYRLPKTILQKEIDLIEKMGAKFIPNTQVGKDISFEHIRSSADATVVAIGAWNSTKLGCTGEEHDGVLGGIEFLENYVTNKLSSAGKRVAIVGGGNTAMDACRSSIRLGSTEVYNIYRRTKEQMPAEQIEIEEAEEEGVIFKELVNPIKIEKMETGELKLILQKMTLGKPDKSGRQSPEPIFGELEILVVDCIISAIGQIVNPIGFEVLEKTRRGTILADENTFRTNLDGVFAIGDATNKGADIAIAAIGEANRAATIIDGYLKGENISYKPSFYSEIKDMTPEDFDDIEKKYRPKRTHVKPEIRNKNFEEVVFNLTEEEAIEESKRCLECGCMDLYECKLLKCANEYEVQPQKYQGEVHNRKEFDDHPFIELDFDKCILCGLCVRTCEEVMEIGALGLVNRGFDAIVKPALNKPLAESGCIACGQCINSCPTGALQERLLIEKPVQLMPKITKTTCSGCSVGCSINVNTTGDMILKVQPDRDDQVSNGLLCSKGKFGYEIFHNFDRIDYPKIKKGDQLEEATLESAVVEVAKRAQNIVSLYGRDALAILVSDKYTNEDIFAIRELGEKIFKTNNIYSLNHGKSPLLDTTGGDRSTANFDELSNTDLIVVVDSNLIENHTIVDLKIKEAVRKGAKLINVDYELNYFDKSHYLDKLNYSDEFEEGSISVNNNNLNLLRIEKSLCNLTGTKIYDSLTNIETSKISDEIAKAYLEAKNAIIVFAQGELTYDAGISIANIANLANKLQGPRNGIIQLKKNSNSQGISNLNLNGSLENYKEDIEKGKIKGVISFGEDCINEYHEKLQLIAVQDVHWSYMAENAHIVIPATSFAQSKGTITNSEGRVKTVERIFEAKVVKDNWEFAYEIGRVLEPGFGYNSLEEIQAAMSKEVKGYKNIGKVSEFMVESLPIKLEIIPVELGEINIILNNNFNFEKTVFEDILALNGI